MENLIYRFKFPLTLLILILALSCLGVRRYVNTGSPPLADAKSGAAYLPSLFNRSIEEQKKIRTQSLLNDAYEDVVPTDTPRPTRTPPPIPPQQDLTQTNLMILFVILAVVVIIVGVWINRYGEDK